MKGFAGNKVNLGSGKKSSDQPYSFITVSYHLENVKTIVYLLVLTFRSTCCTFEIF